MTLGKTAALLIFVVVVICFACAGCRTASKLSKYSVLSVRTTFVSKGPIDEYEVQPVDAYVDCGIVINDKSVVFTGECPLLTTREKVDTLLYRYWSRLRVVDDSDYTRQYPGDELNKLSEDATGDLTVGRCFVSILGMESESHVNVGELIGADGNSTGLWIVTNDARDIVCLYVDWRLEVLSLGLVGS